MKHHNLPFGDIVNLCIASLKVKAVPVHLVTTNRYNVWATKALLAKELSDSKCHPWQYVSLMFEEKKSIKMGFHLVFPVITKAKSGQMEAEPVSPSNCEIESSLSNNQSYFWYSFCKFWLPWGSTVPFIQDQLQGKGSGNAWVPELSHRYVLCLLRGVLAPWQGLHCMICTTSTMIEKPMDSPRYIIPR